ncbi:MAG: DUF4269 domain-containing protein [Marinilabiliales bacterium]|nr:MAG: DUF4269 domain-containing protein [Marinilabiliales bacterium]
MDFFDISYLQNGNIKQRKVYILLSELKLFENLQSFSPVLAGTIPINIDIENSDLDIICYSKDLDKFKSEVIYYYGAIKGFEIWEKMIRNNLTVISRFKFQDFFIEIFAQDRPVKDQEAYRHMIIENRILQEKGEVFRKQIIQLKRQGYKTEPAFAELLHIEGDPYIELLNYY